MCQMRVVQEKEGVEQILFEDVTSLEILDDRLEITTLFDGPQTVHSLIAKIDFNAGKVILKPLNK